MFDSPYRYRPPFYLSKWFQALCFLGFLSGIAGVVALVIFLKPYKDRAYEVDFDEINKLEKASLIYDRDGGEIGRIFVLNRDPVPLEEVPLHMIQALVAVEDARFFEHDGVDYMGVVRATMRNLKAGEVRQGASTITQQLARNAYGMLEKSYERKLIEAFLAHRIEENFSKAEIMEMYLNRIYFGSGFYGVNAASKGYFGKDVSDVTIAEAAVLCGLIKSPNNLSPFNNPEASRRARNYVFERMVIEKMMTRDEATRLAQTPVTTRQRRDDTKRAFEYAYEQIRLQVVRRLGFEAASQGGFHIYTTIDSKLQVAAQASLVARLDEIENHPDFTGQTYAEFDRILTDWKKRDQSTQEEAALEQNRPIPDYLQGALLVIDNQTGAILSLVGGRDFEHSNFDRTFLARRKPGTAFTPFVYATGFAQGRYAGSKVHDSPIDNKFVQIGGETGILGEWGVEGEYQREDWMPARTALIKGKNAAAVRFGIDIGVDTVVEYAKAAGITFEGEIQKYNSTFLGNSEAHIHEMALAYTVFPNLGRRPEHVFIIDSITDEDGKKIFAVDNTGPSVEVFNPFVAYQVHSALEDVVNQGTAAAARTELGLQEIPVAGKTGTAYDFKDDWFAGYSDKVTCVVWAGFDKAKPIYPGAFSNETVLPIWVDVMNAAQTDFPASEIRPPVSAERTELCIISGDEATEHCYHWHGEGEDREQIRDTYVEFLPPNTSGLNLCPVHRPGGIVRKEYLVPREEQRIASNTLSMGDAIRPRPIGGYHVSPVFLQSPTVLGSDPYNSIQPIIRPRILAPPPKPEADSPEGEPLPEGETETPGTIRPRIIGPAGSELQPGLTETPSPDVTAGGRGPSVNALQPAIGPFGNPEPEPPLPPPPTQDGVPSIFAEDTETTRILPPQPGRIEFD